MNGQGLEAKRFVETDLCALIRYAIKSACECKELQGCTIEFQPGQARIYGVVIPELLRTAIVNLMLNSAESEPNCRIRIELNSSVGITTVEVHDTGTGVPAELRQKVFEPLFTTKPGSSGLGLVAVESVVAVHNGTIQIIESKLGGACFRMQIPARRHPKNSE